MERRNAWKTYTQEQLKELDQINDRYKVCLDEGKTERECIRLTVKEIEKQGYRNLNDIKGSLKTGDKVYAVCMGKSIALFRIGKEPLENGMNILGAHIDSPRIDVKQNPLYENEELAYLDTHYYGGIKKYQWVTLPLALHGVIVKTDGTVQEVSIGEKEEDPVFVVTDLLIHLAGKQMEKKASVVIEGEKLDLLIVDWIGKNISGAGMDPNVTGRSAQNGISRPIAERIVARDLTDEAHHNATGMGNADVTTRRLFDKIDMEQTYPNSLTSRDINGFRIPIVMENDDLAIRFALHTITGANAGSGYRAMWIRDTNHVQTSYVTERPLADTAAMPWLRTDGVALRPVFGADGYFTCCERA